MKQKFLRLNSKITQCKRYAFVFLVALFATAPNAFAYDIDNSATAPTVSVPDTIKSLTDLYSGKMNNDPAANLFDGKIDNSGAGNYWEYKISSAAGGEFKAIVKGASQRTNGKINVSLYTIGGELVKDGGTLATYNNQWGDWNSLTSRWVDYIFPLGDLEAGTEYLMRVMLVDNGTNIRLITVEETVGSIDATLSDLTVGGSTVEGFVSSNDEYTVVLPVGTTTVNVGATATDATVQGVTGTGSISVGEGVTKVVVTVTAAAGNTQEYTVNLVIAKSVPATILMASDAYASQGIDEFADAGLGAIRDGSNYVEYLLTSATAGEYNLVLTHGTSTDPTVINVGTYAPGIEFTKDDADDYVITGDAVGAYTDRTVHTISFSLEANTPTILRVSYDATGWCGNSWGMEVVSLGVPTVVIDSPSNGTSFISGDVVVTATPEVSVASGAAITGVDLKINGAAGVAMTAVGDGSYTYTLSTNSSDESYELIAVATDANASMAESDAVTVYNYAPGAYKVRASWTEVIEAEEYDKGGAGVAFNDVTSGRSVPSVGFRTDGTDLPTTPANSGTYVQMEVSGDKTAINYTEAGEWWAYTIPDIEAEADLVFNYASTGNSVVRMYINGTEYGTFDLTSTGSWTSYGNAYVENISLPNDANSDDDVIKIEIVSGGLNFNSFYFGVVTEAKDELISNSKIYPNPSNGNFTVDLSSFDSLVEVSIYNIAGKMVSQQTFNGGAEARISTDLKTGAYFVKASDGLNTNVERIIIN